MAFDWENSGPAPLNLEQPLAQGENAGIMEAYRQDRIKEEAARESDMRSRLGLDQQAQEFQRNVFAAGAGLRQAQLSEANARATMVQNTANLTVDGAPELADRMHDLNSANTPDEIDALPTALENGTDQQQQQYLQALNAKKQSLAYQIHAKTASDQALNEAQALQQFAANGGQVSSFGGKVVPIDPSFMLDGQPDLGKIGAFNKAATLKSTQAQEDIKTQSAIDINSNKQLDIGQRMTDVNAAKARDTSNWGQGDTVAYKAATQMADTALRSMSALSPGDTHYSFYQGQYQDAVNKMHEIESSYPGATAQAAKGANASAATVVPTVATQADFDALPSGAIYVNQNGKKFQKP